MRKAIRQEVIFWLRRAGQEILSGRQLIISHRLVPCPVVQLHL
jgi:hypothetical protein